MTPSEYDFRNSPEPDVFPEFQAERIFAAIPSLHTSRLILRPMVSSDAADLMQVYGDPEVGRLNRWQVLESEAEAVGKIAVFDRQFREGMRVRWGMEERETGKIIGDIAWVHFDHRIASAEVGFNLSVAFQGRGYMSEALRAVLQYGFGKIGFRRTVAIVVPMNTPCHQLLEAVGFVREGILRQAGEFEGAPVDLWQFGALPAEIRWTRR